MSPWSGGSGWWTWERPFVAWAEREGFAIDVATSQDLERHPEVLDGHRLFLSVGHDEYWSWGMRDTVEGFLAAGGERARSSAGTPAGGRFASKTGRWSASSTERTKTPSSARTQQRLLTGSWSDRRIGRPESSMTGLSFSRGGYSRYGARRSTSERCLHGLATRSLGVRRDGPPLRGRARAEPTPSSATRSTDAT